jgi:hypothetical protein
MIVQLAAAWWTVSVEFGILMMLVRVGVLLVVS